MSNNSHIVQRLKLDLKLTSELNSYNIQSKISELIQSKLVDDINMILNELDSEDTHIFIPKIEIDLGLIKSSEISELFKKRFVTELNKKIKNIDLSLKYDTYPSIKTKASKTSIFDALKHYISKGVFPWWFNSKKYADFDELIKTFLKESSKDFINLIMRFSSSNLKKQMIDRLVLQLKTKTQLRIIKIFIKQETSYSVSVVELIEKLNKIIEKEKLDYKAFSIAVFKIILDKPKLKETILVSLLIKELSFVRKSSVTEILQKNLLESTSIDKLSLDLKTKLESILYENIEDKFKSEIVDFDDNEKLIKYKEIDKKISTKKFEISLFPENFLTDIIQYYIIFGVFPDWADNFINRIKKEIHFTNIYSKDLQIVESIFQYLIKNDSIIAKTTINKLFENNELSQKIIYEFSYKTQISLIKAIFVKGDNIILLIDILIRFFDKHIQFNVHDTLNDIYRSILLKQKELKDSALKNIFSEILLSFSIINEINIGKIFNIILDRKKYFKSTPQLKEIYDTLETISDNEKFSDIEIKKYTNQFVDIENAISDLLKNGYWSSNYAYFNEQAIVEYIEYINRKSIKQSESIFLKELFTDKAQDVFINIFSINTINLLLEYFFSTNHKQVRIINFEFTSLFNGLSLNEIENKKLTKIILKASLSYYIKSKNKKFSKTEYIKHIIESTENLYVKNKLVFFYENIILYFIISNKIDELKSNYKNIFSYITNNELFIIDVDNLLSKSYTQFGLSKSDIEILINRYSKDELSIDDIINNDLKKTEAKQVESYEKTIAQSILIYLKFGILHFSYSYNSLLELEKMFYAKHLSVFKIIESDLKAIFKNKIIKERFINSFSQKSKDIVLEHLVSNDLKQQHKQLLNIYEFIHIVSGNKDDKSKYISIITDNILNIFYSNKYYTELSLVNQFIKFWTISEKINYNEFLNTLLKIILLHDLKIKNKYKKIAKFYRTDYKEISKKDQSFDAETKKNIEKLLNKIVDEQIHFIEYIFDESSDYKVLMKAYLKSPKAKKLSKEQFDEFDLKQQKADLQEELFKHFKGKDKDAIYEKIVQDKIDWLKSDKDEEKIYVNNAGLVLLMTFAPFMFKRLELIDKKHKFVDEAARHKAVHLLQYLVTGQTNYQEYDMSLNKILCGIELEEPIDKRIILSESEKKECELLIKSVINHWKAIKNTTIYGLRGTFLMREGILVKNGKNWNLKVEQKAVDILIRKISWSFSTLALSWNNYIIFVDWNA